AAQGITAFSFTYLVCAPLFAVLLGRRPARQVLVMALAVFAAGNVMTLMSGNLAMYLVSRAMAGIGAGMYLPMAVASAVDLVEPDAMGRALGLIWGANSAGAVMGVPAGLWLASRLGWQATIGLVLLLGTITLIGIAIGQPDRQVPAPPSLREQLRFLVDPRVLSVVGVTCLTATASLGMYDFIAPLQAGAAAGALTVWNVGGLIGTTAIGYVEDHIRNPRAVMAGILVTLAATLMILPSIHSMPVLGLVPFLVWGAMGWAVMTPQQMSLIELEPGREATVVALNSSAVGLGSVFGPALGGLALTAGLDVRYLPYAAAAVLLGALTWQAVLVRQREAA
ncbi:MAG: MFS transporter, partial [Candidatus Xenobia bacterium]